MMDNPTSGPSRDIDGSAEDSTDDESNETIQGITDYDMKRMWRHYSAYGKTVVRPDSDVHARNEHGKTLLHVAVAQSNVEYAEAFIKLGADVNAQTKTDKKTPLCIAACPRKLRRDEMVCMLLYYGADVSITDGKGRTPYMIASEGTRRSRTEVNSFLREEPVPILNDYIENAIRFTSAEWLECLYMVLSSSIARQLIADAEARSKCGSCLGDFFVKLLESFRVMKIEHEDRMALIYLLLGLGATIHIQCIALMHREYGPSEEFKAIIYCTDFCRNRLCTTNICELNIQMAHFLCPTKEEFNEEILCRFVFTPGMQIRCSPQWVVYLLKYFSWPSHVKEELISLISDGRYYYNTSKIMEKLETIPEFPSLVELSRNQTRNYIWQKLTVKNPYRFYDEIKMLGLTKTIEDIICYAQPLY